MQPVSPTWMASACTCRATDHTHIPPPAPLKLTHAPPTWMASACTPPCQYAVPSFPTVPKQHQPNPSPPTWMASACACRATSGFTPPYCSCRPVWEAEMEVEGERGK